MVDVTSSLGGRLKIDRIGNLYDDSGNKIERTPQNDRPRNIHFETGIFLNVPRSLVNPDPGMARMACIPHGTTITLQGNAALLDKNPAPTFAKDNFTPFLMNVPLDPRKNKPTDPFNFREKPSQTITNNDAARLPRNLDRHRDSMSAVMKAPDVLMEEHNINKNITHTIAWRMGNSLLQKQSNPLQQAINILTKVTTILASTKSTDPDLTIEELKNVSGLLQKAANLSNIGFLDGTARDQLGDHTNASVATVTSIFWISRVEYTFKIEHDWTPSKGKDEKVTNTLRITPDKDLSGQPYAWGTVPEFCFPSDRPIKAQTVTVAASQIQVSFQLTVYAIMAYTVNSTVKT